jgi:hypothetical protein
MYNLYIDQHSISHFSNIIKHQIRFLPIVECGTNHCIHNYTPSQKDPFFIKGTVASVGDESIMILLN